MLLTNENHHEMNVKEWMQFISNKQNEYDRKRNLINVKRGFYYTLLLLTGGILSKKIVSVDLSNHIELLTVCVGIISIYWAIDIFSKIDLQKGNVWSFRSVINIPNFEDIHEVKLNKLPLFLLVIICFVASTAVSSIAFVHKHQLFGFISLIEALLFLFFIIVIFVSVYQYNEIKFFWIFEPNHYKTIQKTINNISVKRKGLWLPIFFLLISTYFVFQINIAADTVEKFGKIYQMVFWCSIAGLASVSVINTYWEENGIPDLAGFEFALLRGDIVSHKEILLAYEEIMLGKRVVEWVKEKYLKLYPLYYEYRKYNLALIWLLKRTKRSSEHIKFSKKDMKTKQWLIKHNVKNKEKCIRQIKNISMHIAKATESECLTVKERTELFALHNKIESLHKRIVSIDPRIKELLSLTEILMKVNKNKPDALLLDNILKEKNHVQRSK